MPSEQVQNAVQQVEESFFVFGCDQWQRIRGRLERTFSETAANVILYTMGNEYGSSLAEQFMNMNPALTLSEISQLVLDFLRSHGWGSAVHLDVDADKGLWRLRLGGSFEIGRDFHSKEPSCSFLRGFLSGFFKVAIRSETYCRELRCSAQGSSSCEYELLW